MLVFSDCNNYFGFIGCICYFGCIDSNGCNILLVVIAVLAVMSVLAELAVLDVLAVLAVLTLLANLAVIPVVNVLIFYICTKNSIMLFHFSTLLLSYFQIFFFSTFYFSIFYLSIFYYFTFQNSYFSKVLIFFYFYTF